MKEFQNVLDENRKVAIIPDGIVVISKEMEVIVFNEAASRITGYTEDEFIGKNYINLFFDLSKETDYIKDSLMSGSTFSNLSLSILLKNSKIKNVLASITPIRKENKILSTVFVFRDTKEMMFLNDELISKTYELLDQKNKLDAIFNSSIEGTFTIDSNWTVTSFNNSAEKITGFKRGEAIGKKCWDIFRSSICRNGCHMESTMTKGKSSIGNELEIITKQGKMVPIKVNSGILLNNQNEKIGAVETFIDISELKNLSDHLKKQFDYSNIIGKNKKMDKIFTILESVSKTDSSVLITGESGTGKELVARAIHLNSSRKTAPFIALNCSAFSESLIESELFGHEKGAFTGAFAGKVGRFELASNGTLFLDEIGDISLPLQTKLLRVIETRQFERVGSNKTINLNSRIIAATNKNLSTEIMSGKFREDLFYRINVINIHLPPLRERMDDLALLVDYFRKDFNIRFHKEIKGLSSEVYKIFENYSWPGNIRELENVIEHAFILCHSGIIVTEHLPSRMTELKAPEVNLSKDPKKRLIETERDLIISLLNKNDWNKTRTAIELDINTSTLWRKMKRLNIMK